MIEGQLYHIENAINQSYITAIHQSVQSRLFSKFKITYNVKPDNKTHDQLIFACNVPAKPINYM